MLRRFIEDAQKSRENDRKLHESKAFKKKRSKSCQSKLADGIFSARHELDKLKEINFLDAECLVNKRSIAPRD